MSNPEYTSSELLICLAARLMDELERRGLIGRAQAGGRTREVLVGDERADDADDDAAEGQDG